MSEHGFAIHFCEYNRSNPEYDQIRRPDGSGDYLFLLLKTPMKIRIDGHYLITRENACILFTPGVEQNYAAVKKFRNSYIHFTCEENLGERFQIPLNQIFYPPNCEEIDYAIKQMQEESISQRLFAREREYTCLIQLMISAARGAQRDDQNQEELGTLYERFEKLRLTMLSSYEKEWSTEVLCEQMHMEKSQLYHYYHSFFHSTPHADLTQVRLDKAKNLLTNQALSLGQVGELCGFCNYSHFSRSFRKSCGCSPREYRCQRRKPESLCGK